MGQTAQILVVDDQPINRVLLARLLEAFNFPVLQASNGLEGLQLYMQHRASVCLVFLDLMMPVLDGWATALRMRSFEEEQDCQATPIVAYTSEEVPLGSPLWTRCIESGMNDVVNKPIDKSFTQGLLARYIPWWASPPAVPPNSAASSAPTSCRSSLEAGSPLRASPAASRSGSLELAAAKAVPRSTLHASGSPARPRAAAPPAHPSTGCGGGGGGGGGCAAGGAVTGPRGRLRVLPP